MILDKIENASLYYGLGERLQTALKWLQENDPASLDNGRHEIMGDECYALVMTYDTKQPGQGTFEAHRRYIDVQYIVSGIERMGYANLDDLNVSTEYKEESDGLLLDGGGDFLTTPAGTFVIFWPHDAHMPSMAVDSSTQVKKTVVKVLV